MPYMIWSRRTGTGSVEAPPEAPPEAVPANAILLEDGTPLLDETDGYVTTESA